MPAEAPRTGRAEGPASGLRGRLRRPAAIVGYAAFYCALLLAFTAVLFNSLASWWAVTGYVVLGLVVAAAIALNCDSALGLFRTRKAAAGMSVALAVAAGTVILVAVNYISYRYYFTLDMTEDRRFSLSGETLNWLARLERTGHDLRIVSFVPFQLPGPSPLPADFRQQIVDLLDLYGERSKSVHVEHTSVADKARRESVAMSLGISPANIPKESVVMRYGTKRRDVPITAIFEAASAVPGAVEPVFRGEAAFTSAIRDLLDERPRNVYFVTGHGERALGMEDPADYGFVVEKLRGMNFRVAVLNIMEKRGVPKDADCVVVAGPTRAFRTDADGFDELGAVEQYLANGGKVLALVDNLVVSADHRPSGMERVLKEYGVAVHQNALAVGPGYRIECVPSARHEITGPLASGRHVVVMVQACCLDLTSPARADCRPERILEGTAASWGERRPGDKPMFDPEEDLAGPTTLGVAASCDSGARLVVFSDADFLSNTEAPQADLVGWKNTDLFRNSVSWMVGRTEDLPIPRREFASRVANVTPDDRLPLFAGAVVGPALLMTVLGIVVWRLRSR